MSNLVLYFDELWLYLLFYEDTGRKMRLNQILQFLPLFDNFPQLLANAPYVGPLGATGSTADES
jgi:hypothetical protein